MKGLITIQDLRARAAGRPGAEIAIDLLLVADYPAFVEIINRAIDTAFRRMAENPELRRGRSEDELTIELINLLKQNDIDATHEAKVGGHCDITIRGPNDFAWLAEAKRHSKGYPWLYQGFQQLNTRYSTGLPQHDKGGLIIYTYKPNTLNQMGGWSAYLQANQKGLVVSPYGADPLSFLSTHQHERSGLPYEVRHIPLSLYFAPKDKPKTVKARTKKKGAKKSPRKNGAVKKGASKRAKKRTAANSRAKSR
ncbi:hypothetical protein [Bradyrhizobium sp. SZCCHNPS2010]|uniref:hypothetical protein n=1 Tax=Bradyrhizobium sp. SZCCHNPS2010 TaxID=3057333 RepID=UPI0029168B6A|nr:hypothetical protein [Bradyrhizobium sp. SZCCHNPS2010]